MDSLINIELLSSFMIKTILNLRYLFYIVLPSESMFEKPEDVPRYVVQVSFSFYSFYFIFTKLSI